MSWIPATSMNVSRIVRSSLRVADTLAEPIIGGTLSDLTAGRIPSRRGSCERWLLLAGGRCCCCRGLVLEAACRAVGR